MRRYVLFGKAHTVPQTTLQDAHGIVEVSRSLAASIVLIGYHERGMTLKTYFLDTGNAPSPTIHASQSPLPATVHIQLIQTSLKMSHLSVTLSALSSKPAKRWWLHSGGSILGSEALRSLSKSERQKEGNEVL